MTVSELRRRLQADGVRPDAYGLDDRTKDEAYYLAHYPGGWAVYYWERGLRTGERQFASEDAACRYLLEQILRDPSTRPGSAEVRS